MMNRQPFAKGHWGVALLASIALAGCGGGGGGDDSSGGEPSSGVQLSGVISAPGGQVAFDGGWKKWLAELLVPSAQAVAAGTSPVSAGVVVSLIQIDNSGAQTGAALVTGTTDASGAYAITAPAGFVPASNYVIRAASGSTQLDAIVTDTTVDVDPATDATLDVVLASAGGGSLASITPAAVAELASTVISLLELSDNSGLSAASTASAMSAALVAAVAEDEESNNIATSILASGLISGTVADSSGAPVGNVRIVVRDFNNWVTRAITRTDSSGNYTVRVPPGNYILGAINSTNASMAASEWWTASGGAVNEFGAEKITVASSPLTRDFSLAPGARIRGTITTADSGGVPLSNMKVEVRDFTTDEPVAVVRSLDDGSFCLNLRPGTYTVGAYNFTVQKAYASALYNPNITGGGGDASQALPMNLAAGSTTTTDFALIAGRKIAGTVSDPVSGAVAGMSVRFYTNENAFVIGERTNLAGRYHIWLRPNASGAPYLVRARGQKVEADISNGSQLSANMGAAVGMVTATLTGPNGAVGQAKVGVYDASNAYLGFEISNGDGSVTLYSSVSPIGIEFKLDNGTYVGSSLYDNRTQQSSFTPVSLTVGSSTPTDLGSVTLPEGGVLTGTVTVGAVAAPNYVVQVRSGGTAIGNQFVSTRTQSDGSYSISLPAGQYYVRACVPSGCTTGASSFASVTVIANQDNPQSPITF